MSTDRQKNASRANGSKSHGPVTPAGKLASSRNAIKHGMTAAVRPYPGNVEARGSTSGQHGILSATIVLKAESTDRFLDLFTALLDEFQPETPFEESLIENMAVARWRQMRIWGMEKAGMEHEMRRQGDVLNSAGLDPAEHAATRAAIAFRTLSDDSRSLELINRYESRYDRQYLRAHHRFIETRDRRTPPSAPTPQIAPVPAMPTPSPVPPAPIPTPAALKVEALATEPEKILLPNEPETLFSEKVQLTANRTRVSSHRSYNRDYPRGTSVSEPKASEVLPAAFFARALRHYIITSQPVAARSQVRCAAGR